MVTKLSLITYRYPGILDFCIGIGAILVKICNFFGKVRPKYAKIRSNEAKIKPKFSQNLLKLEVCSFFMGQNIELVNKVGGRKFNLLK